MVHKALQKHGQSAVTALLSDVHVEEGGSAARAADRCGRQIVTFPGASDWIFYLLHKQR